VDAVVRDVLAAVRTEAETGRRIAERLLGFGRRVVLSYPYKLDWVFLEATIQAAALWPSVATVVEARNVAYEASQESALAAPESYLDRASWPGRHHASERCRFVFRMPIECSCSRSTARGRIRPA
jgi:hypothetical protein